MKLSRLDLKTLLEMTYEEKWNAVCGSVRDDGQSGEIALLLGSNPTRAIERAHAASALYHAGRVQYIVSSGGVKWEHNGEMITEADLMARIMREDGVPETAIILDNEARTTKENMICGTLAINRTVKFNNVEHIVIVTSQAHMKRSLLLARAFLPRKLSISGYPACPAETAEQWLGSEENRRSIDNELNLMKWLAEVHIIEDVEI